MTTSPARRIAALSAALALPLTLLAATPATAATVGVATWAELKSAFLVNGDTVRLDADITADALDALAVEAGESIVLNLNGYTLTITTPNSGPAVSVPPTSSLTVNDTSGGILIATGGDFGAGIGGGLFSTSGTLTINGGTITATGGSGGPASEAALRARGGCRGTGDQRQPRRRCRNGWRYDLPWVSRTPNIGMSPRNGVRHGQEGRVPA